MSITIPFESQINRPGRRRCGAATLLMVYRSFGMAIDQETIGEELDGYEPNFNRARTFHLSRNALEYGLAAIPCRLREPWTFLSDIDPHLFRIILNHRIHFDSPLGHYTVFLDANVKDETILFHDPQLGPEQMLTKDALLELWTPWGDYCEITGNIAVLISKDGEKDVVCKKCGNPFAFKPFEQDADFRFQTVFCPWCDAVWRRP